MIKEIAILFLLTFLPFFELRLTIPLGILAKEITLPIIHQTLPGYQLDPVVVVITCIIANIILGIILYEVILLIEKQIHLFPQLNKFYLKYKKQAQTKVEPYTKKYGKLGIALFIAVPLPGSGSYTGSLAAFVLGLKRSDFYKANTIGVILAGLLVTILTMTGRLFL